MTARITLASLFRRADADKARGKQPVLSEAVSFVFFFLPIRFRIQHSELQEPLSVNSYCFSRFELRKQDVCKVAAECVKALKNRHHNLLLGKRDRGNFGFADIDDITLERQGFSALMVLLTE